MEKERPNPDELLEAAHREEEKCGKLRIFFGYAAGVGKTYAMLDEAQQQYQAGTDVLVGYVEPHTRPETMELLEGLPVLLPVNITYKNIVLKEFDLDQALTRKPQLILVDELAHTNAAGCRNKKRYQDIEELLQAGINVYTTVNVQHLESLNDLVEDITGVRVRETVPDYIFDNADIKLVDIPPEELLRRFENGKVYRPERAAAAMNRFFSRENLRSLREISMRRSADRISHDLLEGNPAARPVGMKFLVCISSAPSSAKCIRWTARMAESMHAEWTVLYVETSDSEYIGEIDKKSLRDNMELARRLGGEPVTLYGDDIAAVAAEYAGNTGITNIVLGKNRRPVRNIFKQDFEDRLINMLDQVEIHILSEGNSSKSQPRSYKIQKNHFTFSGKDTLKTLAVLLMGTLLSAGLGQIGLGDQNVIVVYILSVLIISRITSGYLYGVASAVLSVIMFNYFFSEPTFSFKAIQPGYPVTFAVMLLASLITSALTIRINAQAKAAVARERRTEVLYEINKKLLVTRGLDNIINLVKDYLVNLFECTVIFYTTDPQEGGEGSLTQACGQTDDLVMQQTDEQAVAHWVFANQRTAGAGTDTLMGAKGYYFPLASRGKVLGVIGLSCAGENDLNQEQRSFLKIIGSLAAMALERQTLSDEQRKILIEAEKEKMRGNLLRAISHDLRTPLTSIAGASSALLNDDFQLDQDATKMIIQGIREDSEWLVRMVENLLSVTRIKEGELSVSKTPEAAEEIVAEAVCRIKNRFPGRKIHARAADDIIIVPMDGTLIIQVMMNLLENAVKHSGIDAEVIVLLKKEGNQAIFEVLDHGEGIDAEELPGLFESRMPVKKQEGDSLRGMGIGLSICSSIIKAHNGKIEAENRPEGGAVFRVTLPL